MRLDGLVRTWLDCLVDCAFVLMVAAKGIATTVCKLLGAERLSALLLVKVILAHDARSI